MAIRPLLDERYMDADLGEPFYYQPTIEEIVSQLSPSVINNLVSQEVAQAPIQAPVQAPVQTPVQATTVAPKPSQQEIIDSLTKQILGSSDTSKWQGGVSAETAAKDMAKIMAGIGITDISQFGKVTQTGLQEDVRPDGRGGFVNLKGQPVDPAGVIPLEMDGNIVGYSSPTGTQETYGNKETGQAVPITYSERQTGNAFGGTFEGKGNTGYRVEFDASGKPVFYTTGASSNDLFNALQDNKLLNVAANVAATYFGGPAGAAALQLAQGKDIEDAAKAAALAYAGGELSKAISPYLPTTETPIDFVGGTQESINDALAENFIKDLKAAGVTNVSEFINNVGGNIFTPSVETVQVTAPSAPTPTIADVISSIAAQQPVATQEPVSQPVENVQVTAPVQPPVAPTIAEVLNAITQVQTPVEVTAPRVEAPTVETPKTVEQVTAALVPEMVVTGEAPKFEQPIIVAPPIMSTLPEVTTIAETPSTITNEVTNPPVITAPPITETVPPKTYTTREIIDMIRLGMFGASVLGAANQDTGPTGFPIVPVPEDWRSPTYNQGSMGSMGSMGTQLPPIDFGNRNMLIGTQWERFLNPSQPIPQRQFNQPSNMSYDRLMEILGTGRDTLPSQALSINDVISGIQNQYGQAPQGTMG